MGACHAHEKSSFTALSSLDPLGDFLTPRSDFSPSSSPNCKDRFMFPDTPTSRLTPTSRTPSPQQSDTFFSDRKSMSPRPGSFRSKTVGQLLLTAENPVAPFASQTFIDAAVAAGYQFSFEPVVAYPVSQPAEASSFPPTPTHGVDLPDPKPKFNISASVLEEPDPQRRFLLIAAAAADSATLDEEVVFEDNPWHKRPSLSMVPTGLSRPEWQNATLIPGST